MKRRENEVCFVSFTNSLILYSLPHSLLYIVSSLVCTWVSWKCLDFDIHYTYTCTKTRHNTLKTKLEGKKGLYCEGDKLLPSPQCLLLIGYNIKYYYYPIKWHQGFGPADYSLVLSGALGKPCTRVMYS